VCVCVCVCNFDNFMKEIYLLFDDNANVDENRNLMTFSLLQTQMDSQGGEKLSPQEFQQLQELASCKFVCLCVCLFLD